MCYLADLRLGQQAHTHAVNHEFKFEYGPKSDIFAWNTHINMYVKCGSVEDGKQVFEKMVQKEYGVEPMSDHYACIVDLLGRYGCLDEAKNLVDSMPTQPDAVVCGSLVGGRKVHGNIELGKGIGAMLNELERQRSNEALLNNHVVVGLTFRVNFMFLCSRDLEASEEDSSDLNTLEPKELEVPIE
ncbi:pentatricopeptide repeat-containing protein [Tanacetum coccineum]